MLWHRSYLWWSNDPTEGDTLLPRDSSPERWLHLGRTAIKEMGWNMLDSARRKGRLGKFQVLNNRKAARRDVNSACMLGGSVVSDSLRPLFVTLADDSPPCSSVHGIFQARILEWVAVSFSRASSRPRERIRISCSSCVGRWVLHHWVTWEALAQVEQGLIGKLHVTGQGICTLSYRQGMFS